MGAKPAEQAELPSKHALSINAQKIHQLRTAEIIGVRELRQKATPLLSSLEVTLALPDESEYLTADNLLIFPKNKRETVENLLKHFSLHGSETISYNQAMLTADDRLNFPDHTSVRDILENYIDLNSGLKNSQLKKIQAYDPCADLPAIEKLKQNYVNLADVVTLKLANLSISQLLDVGNAIAVR